MQLFMPKSSYFKALYYSERKIALNMRTKNWFAPSNYSPFTVSSNEKERIDTDLDNDFSSETNSRERLH